MFLRSPVKDFCNGESGAVTIDWVVLTAAIVGIGIAVLAPVERGLTEIPGKIASDVANEATQTYSF